MEKQCQCCLLFLWPVMKFAYVVDLLYFSRPSRFTLSALMEVSRKSFSYNSEIVLFHAEEGRKVYLKY